MLAKTGYVCYLNVTFYGFFKLDVSVLVHFRQKVRLSPKLQKIMKIKSAYNNIA